jgi:hypothetical protein
MDKQGVDESNRAGWGSVIKKTRKTVNKHLKTVGMKKSRSRRRGWEEVKGKGYIVITNRHIAHQNRAALSISKGMALSKQNGRQKVRGTQGRN